MIEVFFKALSALTSFSPHRKDTRLVPSQHAVFFISYSIIGLAIGMLSMLFLRRAYGSLPILTSWFIPVLWLGLTGSKHMGELYRTLNALSDQGTPAERLVQFSRNVLVIRSLMVLLIVFSGKIFALLQAQILDPFSLSIVVLYVPIFSRYTAAMFAFGLEGGVPGNPDAKVQHKLPILLASSAFVIAAIYYQIVLGVLLLVACMLTAFSLYFLCFSCLGKIRPAALGAVIELSELLMLWFIAIFVCTGHSIF